MVIAGTSDNKFILGLDAEDLRKLQNDEMISINLSAVGGSDVILTFGETEKDIKEHLEAQLGQPKEGWTEH